MSSKHMGKNIASFQAIAEVAIKFKLITFRKSLYDLMCLSQPNKKVLQPLTTVYQKAKNDILKKGK